MITPAVIPNSVRVIVQDQETTSPVAGLVVLMMAIVPRKNNYTFGPKITDAAGKACFTRDEMMRGVHLNQKHSPMDYASSLAEMTGLEVEIPDTERIARLLEAARMWGAGEPEWRLSDEMIERLKGASNRRYEPISVSVGREEFSDVLEVKVSLQRRRGSPGAP